MLNYIRTMLRQSERGASALEYALLVAGTAAVLFGIWQTMGDSLREVFEDEHSRMECTQSCYGTPTPSP